MTQSAPTVQTTQDLTSSTTPTVQTKPPKDRYYTCPTSSVEYKNSCPILNCPANIAHVEDSRPSGCFYNFLSGKQTVSKYEVAYAFGIPVKDVDYYDSVGRAGIQTITLFYEMVKQVRQWTSNHNMYCSSCGCLRTTPGDCINHIKCNERLHLANKLLKLYPFNIEEFELTHQDVFKLLANRKRINRILKSKNVEGNLTFRQVTSLDKHTFQIIVEMNAIV